MGFEKTTQITLAIGQSKELNIIPNGGLVATIRVNPRSIRVEMVSEGQVITREVDTATPNTQIEIEVQELGYKIALGDIAARDSRGNVTLQLNDVPVLKEIDGQEGGFDWGIPAEV